MTIELFVFSQTVRYCQLTIDVASVRILYIERETIREMNTRVISQRQNIFVRTFIKPQSH